MDFKELQNDIMQFSADRNWEQFNTPKDLAISISLEAAELLECFQWSGIDLVNNSKREAMLEELADIMIYCTHMTVALGADPVENMNEKLAKNAVKYPVDKSYGNAKKYTEL